MKVSAYRDTEKKPNPKKKDTFSVWGNRVKMAGGDIENRGGAKRNSNSINNSSGGSYISSSTYMIDDTELQWTSWLVPVFVVANVAVFLVVMYVNNCPKHKLVGKCVARFLGRFSFEPLRENPLFGPSSST